MLYTSRQASKNDSKILVAENENYGDIKADISRINSTNIICYADTLYLLKMKFLMKSIPDAYLNILRILTHFCER